MKTKKIIDKEQQLLEKLLDLAIKQPDYESVSLYVSFREDIRVKTPEGDGS